jgi:hypothetical protein
LRAGLARLLGRVTHGTAVARRARTAELDDPSRVYGAQSNATPFVRLKSALVQKGSASRCQAW